MDEDLLVAYLATDYRVRTSSGRWASIQINQPLPDALEGLVDGRRWGFITAWNPRSQPCSRQLNRLAQRTLLQTLRAQPGVVAIHAAAGVGSVAGWREPSLFVIGPGTEVLDGLANRFQQRAYLHGDHGSPAMLRWM